jgi:hypothetical protein
MPFAPLLSSGIGPVDAAWGGLARPGAYLVVGAAAQGRLDLTTRIVGAGAAAEEPTLLFSAREPVAILALARQAGVDLDAAGERVHLKGVPLGAQLAALGEDGLSRMLESLAESARGTARVVVEDFTPFVRFRSFDAFGQAFQKLVHAVDGHGATLVLGLGEPANDGSRRLLDFVEQTVSGTIRLADGGRVLHLIPGQAHASLEAQVAWDRTAVAPSVSDDVAPSPAPRLVDEGEHVEEFRDHAADGYGGTDADALDAGALVVSAIPPEPFGYPAAERTGGDGELWASIQAVEAPASSGDGRVEPVSGGFLIDSDHLGITLPEPVTPPDAPVESASIEPAEPERPEATPVRGAGESLMSVPDFGSEDPEAGFTVDLDEAYHSAQPFLVIALRVAPDSPHFHHFPTVADGFLGALTGSDRALVRDDEARLIAILPAAPADAPQRLMAAVRDHLSGLLGARAESVFRSVGVLVLPQGQPFDEPQALLDYVLG